MRVVRTPRHPAFASLPFALLAALSGVSCTDTDADGLGAVAKTGARIEIRAASTHVTLGERLELTTTVYDQNGAVVAYAQPNQIQWKVSEPAKAVFDACSQPTCPTHSLVGLEVGTVELTASFTELTAPFKGQAPLGEVTGSFRVSLDPGVGAWGAGYLYGSNDNEGGENLVADQAGNLYVGGASAAAFDGQVRDSVNAVASVGLVSRFLPNGKKAWTRLVRGGNTSVNGIALAQGGGVFVATAPVLTRLDSAGNTLWHKEFFGAKITDVASDSQGNVFITGGGDRQYKLSNPICPTEPDPSTGGTSDGGATDGFLLKMDATGKPLWCKTFTYILPDPPTNTIPVAGTFGTSIEIDEANGKVYLGGLVQLNFYYGLNPFLRKFDLNTGATEWMKFINGYDVGDAPNRLGSTFSAEAGVPNGTALDGDGNVWNSVYDTLFRRDNPNFSQPPIAHLVKVSPSGQELLRLRIQVSAVPGNDTLQEQPLTALTYRPIQRDIVALARKQNTLGGDTTVALGLKLNEKKKWRQEYTVTPQLAGKNSAGIVLKDVTALANGDLFAVGETANDFAGMKNQTRELTNLQVLGTDIAIAHIGLRP